MVKWEVSFHTFTKITRCRSGYKPKQSDISKRLDYLFLTVDTFSKQKGFVKVKRDEGSCIIFLNVKDLGTILTQTEHYLTLPYRRSRTDLVNEWLRFWGYERKGDCSSGCCSLHWQHTGTLVLTSITCLLTGVKGLLDLTCKHTHSSF